MTIFTLPNNNSSMKYALKSVSGIAKSPTCVWEWDGPRAPPRCQEGVRKKYQMTHFSMLNNISGISQGQKHTHHVDLHEKLKGLGG